VSKYIATINIENGIITDGAGNPATVSLAPITGAGNDVANNYYDAVWVMNGADKLAQRWSLSTTSPIELLDIPLVSMPNLPVLTVGTSGAVTMNWRGAWSSSTTYAKDETVSSGGRSWISLQAGNLNHQPPSTNASDAWWSLVADKGATGTTGPAGAAGATGPQGATGAQGPTGATGPQGPTGAQGPTGPAGAAGPSGADGLSVLNGTTDPAAGVGVDGEFYINTTTNNIFGPKAAGVWPAGVSLVGPTGATGATGATGVTGATGPQGPTGATGAAGQSIDHVSRTAGNGAAGTTDTYTVWGDAGATINLGTFSVYNGANGAGAGDMTIAVYDPTGKSADAFSMTNMAEGATNKILTAAERTDIANNKVHAASAHAPANATANATDAALRDTDTHTDGATNGVYTLAERTKLAGVAIKADVSPVFSVAGKTGAVTLVKADVGLGSVDNTADTAKPVSTAQQTALDAKAGLATVNAFTAAQRAAPVALADAATVAMDASLSNFYTLTLAGNRTLGAPTNMVAGQAGSIRIAQDATGSRTLSFNAVWKFPSGTAPTLTTTASAIDRLDYYVVSATEIHAMLASDVK